MITARNVTEAQIRELMDLTATRVEPPTPPPPGVSVNNWKLSIVTDCAIALGVIGPSRVISEDANEQLREQARVRCAEVLEARRNMVEKL